MDQGFCAELELMIKKDPSVQLKFRIAKLYGGIVVPCLVKQKKYRQQITEFVDQLRRGKNFRDRQVYLKIAKSTLKADKEVFKKYFAKSIGTEMCNEKVKVVQVMMAKLMMRVTPGYSRSCDKVREHLVQNASADVKQFLMKVNAAQYIDPLKFKLALKDEEETKQ